MICTIQPSRETIDKYNNTFIADSKAKGGQSPILKAGLYNMASRHNGLIL